MEIQDTVQENIGIVCHGNSMVEQKAKCFPTLTSDQYTPRPLDRPFNHTKLIWTEMTLFQLLGLNMVSLISADLLNYSYFYRSEAINQMYWTQALFSSGVSALVVVVLVGSYRFFTIRKPHYRKVAQNLLIVVLSLLVIILSKFSLINKF